MQRRRALRSFGVAMATVLSGCLGDDDTGGADGSPEATDDDGATDEPHEDEFVAANEFGYDTLDVRGVLVPLVPMDDAIVWHQDDDAEVVFADTRDETVFEHGRIAGAVFSPAPTGLSQDDPLEDLSTETTIVTYCTCPHSLAAMRAAALIREGYVHTYALDEGFGPWVEAGYPMEEGGMEGLSAYRVDGETDTGHAGEFAWARHPPSGQREAVPIRDDGTFTLYLHFHDIDERTHIQLETPAATIEGPLERFLDRTVEL